MFWRIGKESRQEGQALVETVFMISAVLLLLMGIIEFGFIFYAHVRVSNAAREGVRAGSLWLLDREADKDYYSPILCDTVHPAVQSEFSAIAESDITITLEGVDVLCPDDGLTPEAGERIDVAVNYQYPLPIVSTLPIIGDVIPSVFPVSRTAVMRFQ